jgi:hypothetical protein
MRRRRFLMSAGAAAGMTAVPLARAASGPLRGDRFVLLRAEEASAGSPLMPHALAPCQDCSASALHVSIDGMHFAVGGAVLDDLAVHAMFDLPGGSSVPFVAWRYSAGPVPSRTDRAHFVVDRATVRRFELEYRVTESPGARHETCALTRVDAPLLTPGHYVLAGPRRSGARVDPRGFVHTGDFAAPLAGPVARDFDYLALRIEPA